MMIRVYLTNLGAYNRGEIIGKWVDLPMDEDKLQEEIDSILEPIDEEFFITDFETDIEGLKIDTSEDIFDLNILAEEVDALSKDEQAILQAIFIVYTSDLMQALELLKSDDYIVYWNVTNERELGERIVDEGLLGEIPEQLQYYIDYEAIGHDWCVNGVTIIPELDLAIEIL